MSLQTLWHKLKSMRLSGNQLKLIAAATMVVDHVAFYLVPYGNPEYFVLRSIGRIAFPIFAYFIAEGCFYSKNKLKYLGLIFVCAAVAEGVFAAAGAAGMYTGYFSIFATFLLGIIAAYLYGGYRDSVSCGDKPNAVMYLAALAVFLLSAAYIDMFVRHYEYGIGGVLIILFCYAVRNKYLRLIGYSVGCLVVCVTAALSMQYYMFLSVPLLLLYSGRRGKLRMKYFFYLFYPGHVALILLVGVATGLI